MLSSNLRELLDNCVLEYVKTNLKRNKHPGDYEMGNKKHGKIEKDKLVSQKNYPNILFTIYIVHNYCITIIDHKFMGSS